MYIMNEKDIKIKVFEYLLKKKEDLVIVPEVTLGSLNYMNTKGAVRADIFCVNNDISIFKNIIINIDIGISIATNFNFIKTLLLMYKYHFVF